MKRIRRKIYNISKKYGDKIGIDLPYFVENGFWMMFNQAVVLAASLATSVVFARYFSKEVYGQYQLVLSVIAFVSFFSIPGLNTSVSKSVAEGCDGDFKKAVQTCMKWSLAGSFVLLCVSAYYFHKSSDSIAIAVLISGIFFPFLYSPNKWQAILKGKAKFKLFTHQTVIQTLIKSATILIVAVLFPDFLLPVIVMNLVSTAFFHTFWYIKSLKLRENTLKGKDTFSYGKFMTKMSILSTVVNNFDKIIVGFLDIEILAVYSIALALINTVKSFIKSVSSITFPKFTKRNIRLNYKQQLILFFTGIVLTAVLFFIADDLITLLYTEKYLHSVRIFKFFILILPFFMISSILSKKILARKNKNKLIQIRLLVPILTLFSSVSVYIFTGNIEYFIFTKFFVLNILNYIILILPSKKV